MRCGKFYIFPDGTGAAVYSTERFRGKRASSQPQGGYFTGATHVSDQCNQYGGVWLSDYTDLNFTTTVVGARIRGTWSSQGATTNY